MALPQTSGALLRRARHLARQTQRELAVTAGVPQSVVSAYETGAREPPVSTLRRLVRAAGYDLLLDLGEPPNQGSPLTGHHGPAVQEHARAIVRRLGEEGLVDVRVIGRVACSSDRRFDPVELLADPGPGHHERSTWIRGLVGLWLDAEVWIHLPTELSPEAHEEALRVAVPLSLVGRPVDDHEWRGDATEAEQQPSEDDRRSGYRESAIPAATRPKPRG